MIGTTTRDALMALDGTSAPAPSSSSARSAERWRRRRPNTRRDEQAGGLVHRRRLAAARRWAMPARSSPGIAAATRASARPWRQRAWPLPTHRGSCRNCCGPHSASRAEIGGIPLHAGCEGGGGAFTSARRRTRQERDEVAGEGGAQVAALLHDGGGQLGVGDQHRGLLKAPIRHLQRANRVVLGRVEAERHDEGRRREGGDGGQPFKDRREPSRVARSLRQGQVAIEAFARACAVSSA